MVMQGTKKERWLAVYGAAYVDWKRCGWVPSTSVVSAKKTADEAIAAEPDEDAGEARWIEAKHSSLPDTLLLTDNDNDSVYVRREDAFSLAMTLIRFAETGEL